MNFDARQREANATLFAYDRVSNNNIIKVKIKLKFKFEQNGTEQKTDNSDNDNDDIIVKKLNPMENDDDDVLR